MSFIATKCETILEQLVKLNLIRANNVNQTLALFDSNFIFTSALIVAESVHIHIKVPDVEQIPHEAIIKLEAIPSNQKPGYIKYSFNPGLNVIFSSIAIAEEDCLPNASAIHTPQVDHFGIDIRIINPTTRKIFDEIPLLASNHHWRIATQAYDNKAVYCCHVSVTAKHWVYPPSCSLFTQPIEFAYGPLTVHEKIMGCDLRPIDPILADKINKPTCTA